MSQASASESYDPYALLGDFRTGLWLPQYAPIQKGPWALRRIMMAGARGYWGDVYRLRGTVVLTGPGVEATASWMSMTPSEIESQEIGLGFAHGHTVVVGLGMGWLAANVALRESVSRVTVVERDSAIIEIVSATGVFAQLPAAAREKIEIVNADALEWQPHGPVDTLQADIWERFVEERKLSDVRRMQENMKAEGIYFWGQEMEIWRYACRRQGPEPALDWPLIRTIVAQDIGLPLLLPDWPDYPQKIAAATPWWTPQDDGWYGA